MLWDKEKNSAGLVDRKCLGTEVEVTVTLHRVV